MDRARATLRIYSEHLTLSEITSLIEQPPLNGHTKGDINPRTGKVFEESLWKIKSTSQSKDLEDHIDEMIKYLQAHRLHFDKTKVDCSADLFCLLVTKGGQAGVVIQSEMMAILSDFGLRLIFDIYGE